MPAPSLWKHGHFAQRALLLSTALLMAAGCAPVEVRESRNIEAVLSASRGEPPEALARKLAAQGYDCTTGEGATSSKQGALQCSSRKGNLWPPYSCIFRVDLTTGEQAGSTGASPSVSHACAGL